MTPFIKFSLIALMSISMSCDSAKSSATNTDETSLESTKQMETTLINEGFSMGTIAYMKDSKCTYIIVDEKTGVKFDPINIDKKEYESFKSADTKVYYKYRPLRMMNRCPEAQPIELLEIKQR